MDVTLNRFESDCINLALLFQLSVFLKSPLVSSQSSEIIYIPQYFFFSPITVHRVGGRGTGVIVSI